MVSHTPFTDGDVDDIDTVTTVAASDSKVDLFWDDNVFIRPNLILDHIFSGPDFLKPKIPFFTR